MSFGSWNLRKGAASRILIVILIYGEELVTARSIERWCDASWPWCLSSVWSVAFYQQNPTQVAEKLFKSTLRHISRIYHYLSTRGETSQRAYIQLLERLRLGVCDEMRIRSGVGFLWIENRNLGILRLQTPSESVWLLPRTTNMAQTFLLFVFEAIDGIWHLFSPRDLSQPYTIRSFSYIHFTFHLSIPINTNIMFVIKVTTGLRLRYYRALWRNEPSTRALMGLYICRQYSKLVPQRNTTEKIDTYRHFISRGILQRLRHRCFGLKLFFVDLAFTIKGTAVTGQSRRDGLSIKFLDSRDRLKDREILHEGIQGNKNWGDLGGKLNEASNEENDSWMRWGDAGMSQSRDWMEGKGREKL